MTSLNALVLAAALVWGAASGARADAFETCRGPARPEQKLAACSDVIAGAGYSVEQKAIAYRNRGRQRTEAGVL